MAKSYASGFGFFNQLKKLVKSLSLFSMFVLFFMGSSSAQQLKTESDSETKQQVDEGNDKRKNSVRDKKVKRKKSLKSEGLANYSIKKKGKANVIIYKKKQKESEGKKSDWSIERDRFDFDMLKDPATGKIPRDAAQKASVAAKKAKKFGLKVPVSGKLAVAPTIGVTGRGPNNLGGRTRAIGFDARNPNIMLAGSVSSGVFRTTNGGVTWARVAPIGQIHNVTAIVQDPRPGFQDTWYYGGGEGLGNSASLGSPYRGFGIWKSTDNGINWAPLPSTQGGAIDFFDSPFDYVARIAIDPVNGTIYVAASNTIQVSKDGGATWTNVLGTLANSSYTDVIVTPGGRAYATFDGTEASAGVWTSTTGDLGSWTRIATPGTTLGWKAIGTYGRTVLAYAPSNPDIVFALYWNGVTHNSGNRVPEAHLFRWDNSASTWTNLSANMPDETGYSAGNDPFAVQGGYDLVVAVKPDDINTVFIGGTNVYRSTDGFTSNTNTTRIGGYNSPASYALYPNHHPDIHVLNFAPGDNNTLYSGDDGGIHKGDITVPTVVWTSLNNNYTTYQYYHADINPANGSSFVAGGAQDNGTTVNPGGTSFSSIFGGDGCQTGIISYTGPAAFNIIGATQNGNLVRLTGPSAGFSIRPSGSTGSIFVTYFHLDQDNTNLLYNVDLNRMHRTRNARNLTGSATGDPALVWQRMTGIVLNGNIRCLATSRDEAYGGLDYSASDANRKLYIGTSTGRVYRLNDPAFVDAATVPSEITPAGATGLCSSISVNPFDDNEVIVTFSNYNVVSVYHSFNAGSATPTWTAVEGPANTPVTLSSARSSIITKILGVSTYFVGTSTGLYSTQTLNGASTVWDLVGSNEINYAIGASMRLRVSDNTIVLGTHGNGMFEINLPSVCTPISITAQNVCLNGTYTFTQSGGVAGGTWSVTGGGTIDAATGSFTATTAGEGFTVRYTEPGQVLCFGSTTFNVTTPPVFTSCPSNQSVNNTPGLCSAVVNYTATASGTPAATYTYSYTGATTASGNGTGSGSAFNVGVTTVTITATNTCGNPTCTFTVTVVDNEPPTFNCPPAIQVFGCSIAAAPPSYATIFEWAAAGGNGVENCTINNASFKLLSEVITTSTACQKVYTRTYYVEDASGNSATCTQTVTVIDNTAPTGSNPTAITGVNSCTPTQSQANADFNATLAASGYSDACGGAVTAELVSASVSGGNCGWTVTYTFRVKDVCGNYTSNQTYTRSGSDQTAPTGSNPTAITGVNSCTPTQAQANADFNATLAASGYSDACSAVTAELVSASVSGGNCGWTVIYTFRVKDVCGNYTSNQTYTRSGSDQTAPTGINPTAITGVNSCTPTQAQADAVFNATLAASGYTDACGGAVTAELVSASVNGNNCGWTVTYTFRVKDVCGNYTSNQTYTRSGSDQTPPTITGESATPNSLWPPNHKMRDIAVNYTATDNCGTVTTTLSVVSNEPDNGTGDGDMPGDIEIVNNRLVRLRAERAGNGNGRIYTITIRTTDGCNITTKTVSVVVAHNITAPVSGSSFRVGSTVNFAGTFWDKPGNRHTATWAIDGTSVTGTVVEPSGLRNGTVTGSYKFNSPGVYKLQMNVRDQTGVVSYANTQGDLDAIVVIYDPNGGYTYGGGWFASPAGSVSANSAATGKVSYGFNSNYFKNATNPKGETQMQFQVGDLEFNALNFEYLAISGSRAQYKGSGKITGDQAGYSFIMTVIDGQLAGGGGTDKIRLKIFNKNTGAVIYDNQPGASDAADPTTAVGNGSTIVIVNPNATAAKATEGYVLSEMFDAKVLPNPTVDQFVLRINSTSKEPVQVRVLDILGRKLTEMKAGSDQTIQFGRNFIQGIYFVEIIQGSNRKVIKLEKL